MFPSDIRVHHFISQHKWLPPGPTKVGDWFLQVYVTSKRWAQHWDESRYRLGETKRMLT